MARKVESVRLASLRLADYSDRELLQMVADVADENGGWASSSQIAQALGMEHDARVNNVGSRMAAMRRFGAVAKHDESYPAQWRLTPIGEIMSFGAPDENTLKIIQKAKPEELLVLTRVLGQRRTGEPEAAAHLIRREWSRAAGLLR